MGNLGHLGSIIAAISKHFGPRQLNLVSVHTKIARTSLYECFMNHL